MHASIYEDTFQYDFIRGTRHAMPLLMAVATYALILGAQSSQTQLTLSELVTMTGLNFAGGSEFAALNLWDNPPPTLLIVLVTFLINSRHIVMGAALVPYLGHLPKRKVLPALFFMGDEGWAISLADTARNARAGSTEPFSWAYYWGSCWSFYPVWVGCSALGAMIGPHLGNLNTYGFEIVFPAVFMVLLRHMWRGFRFARPWIVSLSVAIATYLLVPGAWYIIAGTLAGIVSAYYWAEVA